MSRHSHPFEHEAIRTAYEEGWLDRDRLLVHLATHHGFSVLDVANHGWVPLRAIHDHKHGMSDALDIDELQLRKEI